MKPLLAVLATLTLAAPFALAIDGNGLNDRVLDPLKPNNAPAPPAAEDDKSHCDQEALDRLMSFDGKTDDGIGRYLRRIDLSDRSGRTEVKIHRPALDKKMKKSEAICDFSVWIQAYHKDWYAKDVQTQAKLLDSLNRALMAAERRQEAAAKEMRRVSEGMSLESSGQTPVQTKLPTIFTED